MRISTSFMYNQSVAAMDQQQTQLAQTQQQISTGLKVNTPADDPVAAAQIMQVNQTIATNTQYATNQSMAQSLLAQTDSTLSAVNNVLQNVHTTLQTAGNGALAASDITNLATQLQGQLSQLVGLANTQDSNGNYLFGGYQSTTIPFTQTPTGATYNGDNGSRNIQVTGTQQIAATVSGDAVFQRVPTGNGVFTTGASASNTGGASIDTGTVVSPSALTGDQYSIQFTKTGSATTYSVVNTTTGATVNAPSASNSYTSGNAISFDGMQMTISGTPASGDTFTVGPSTHQSVFASIQQAIAMLQTAAKTASPSKAVTIGGLDTAIQNINQAITNTSTVQTVVGVNENALTQLTSANTTQATNLQAQLSGLQNTDMAAAASQLVQQQTALTAAEQVFAKISGNSLFNYIT